MAAVTAEHGFDCVKVRIDGRLHLIVPRSTFRGLQSWRWGDRYHAIEISVAGSAPILSEYERAELFEAVLSELDRLL